MLRSCNVLILSYTRHSHLRPANPVLVSKNSLVKALSVLSYATLGTTYSAFDFQRNETVALKIEKPDKPKRILSFEYQILQSLQNLPHICPVYEFVDFTKTSTPQGLNFIVMEMLGKSLASVKHQGITPVAALELLVNFKYTAKVQMLDAIQELHGRGYIHRDIKPSNFLLGRNKKKKKVYMIDFGLCKQHLDAYGIV